MTVKRDSNPDEVTFRAADGVVVRGTFLSAAGAGIGAAVLVHGLTEDRDEAFGFYEQLALRLAANEFSSVRFDLRGHGKSSMSYDDLTLFNGVTDIEAAVDFVSGQSARQRVHLIGTSFGGGLAVLYAARHHSRLASLVLLCPNLDYRRNWLEKKAFWSTGALTSEGAELLAKQGALPHNEFRIGRCMFHELLHVRPFEWMAAIDAPCLTVHGTADSVVPHDLSAKYFRCNDHSELLLIEGADHGFAVPGDETFSSSATQAHLDRVFTAVTEWLRRYNDGGTG